MFRIISSYESDTLHSWSDTSPKGMPCSRYGPQFSGIAPGIQKQ